MIVGVRVVPNSSRTEIVGWMADGFLKIKLAAPPVDGEANRELIFFLAKTLGIPKNEIEIMSGLTNKKKMLRLPFNEDEVSKKLGLAKQTPLL